MGSGWSGDVRAPRAPGQPNIFRHGFSSAGSLGLPDAGRLSGVSEEKRAGGVVFCDLIETLYTGFGIQENSLKLLIIGR